MLVQKAIEGNDTTRKVKMTLDGETIISTYFQEEINDGIIQLSMGTSSNVADLQTYLQQASNIAVFLNTKPMPITYKMDVNRFVYSDITANTLNVMIIVLLVIALIMAIFMIVKYKKNGMMGVIANIGFTAILLLAVRYGNVVISLSGIFTIVVAIFIEYIITMLILKEYSKKYNAEITKKNIKQLLGKIAFVLIPIMIMAVTFALMSWEEIASAGMILFWAVLIMAIYNILILSVRLFTLTNNTKKENNIKKSTEAKVTSKEVKKEKEIKQQAKKEEKKVDNTKTKSKKENTKKTTKKKK